MIDIVTLKNQKEFDFVNKHGKKFFKKYFVLIASQKNTSPQSNKQIIQYGMKVGYKFSKKAVIRNKAKRRIRHLVREIYRQNSNNINQIKSFFIIPKKNFEQVKFDDLFNDLTSCIHI